MSTIRVLHVDDEPSFGDLVSDVLEREDDRIEVVTETSAADGLARIGSDKEHIDCIVSDYEMPDMDGLEFLDAIRDDAPELPFILYTGKGSEEVASEAISKGATDYLQKGGGTEQYELLTNRVRNAVDQYRSERRADEHERITRITREINRALVYAESVDEIEHDICTILSNAEPYITACIADIDPETMQIDPRTYAGVAAGYFEELDMSVDEGSPGREAPGGRAYHDREIAILQNITADPQYERWHEAATDRGFRSLAVVPLEYEGDLYGLLAVFADRPFAFDDTERGLLSELGDDIAHAMHVQKMQTELRSTASRLEALFERSPDMIHVHDTDGNLIDPNPQLCNKTGYDEHELTRMKVWELDTTLEPDEAYALWERIDVGEAHMLEGEYQRKDGSSLPVEVHIRRLDLAGEDRFIAISRDISDRKQRERELERHERILENLPVGVFRTAPAGDIVSMNKQFVSLFDGESEEDFTDVEAGDLYADAADREKILRQLEREGLVAEHEHEVVTLSGEIKWIETTLRLTEEDGDRYIDGIVQDVTERRKRTRRLDQAETLFENAKDALFLIDVDEEFRVERINPAYEEELGFSDDALRGRFPRDIFDDVHGAEIEQKYQECVDQVTALEYEKELIIDGDRTYWETRIAPVVIDGEVQTIVGATRNITERKEREQELRRNERRFEAMFNDPNILVGLIDTDGTVLDINETAMEYIDAELSEVTGQPFWETSWFSGDETIQEEVRQWVEQAAAGEYVDFEIDLSETVDDQLIVSGVFRPVTNDDGEVVSLLISDRDITERKDRERRLKQYETIVETTDDLVYALDADGQFTVVNEAIAALAGVSRDDLLGEHVSTVFPEETVAAFEERIAAILAGGERTSFTEEVSLRHVDGAGTWYEINITLLRAANGRFEGTTGVARDITERKRREARLAGLNEVTAEFHEADSPQQVADIVVDGASSLLNLPVALVAFYDGATNSLNPVAATPGAASALNADELVIAGADSWRAFADSKASVVSNPGDGASDAGPIGVWPLGRHGVFVASMDEGDETATDTFGATVAGTMHTALDSAERLQDLEQREARLTDMTAQLERLNRVNDVIRRIDRTLVDVTSRAAIDEAVCEELARVDPYQFVVVSDYDQLEGTVAARAWAGDQQGYLDTVGPDGDPTTIAAETRDPQVVQDLLTDPPLAPWREAALARGFGSCLALPLVYGDSLYGVLTVFGDRPQLFDEMEQAVLAELADNIAYAVNAVESKQALVSDHVVELEFAIQSEKVSFVALATETGGTFAFEGVVPQSDDRLRGFFTVRGAAPDDVHAFLRQSVAVEDCQLVADRDDDLLFSCLLTDAAVISHLVDHGVVPRELTAEPGEGRLVVDLSPTRDIREFIQTLEARYPDVELIAKHKRERSLQTRQGFRAAIEDSLTDRQLEVLRTAYHGGYFESPRVSTGEKLAASLDISQPTFSDHLRTAHRKLLTLLFEEPLAT